jgi:hypothetical protein
VIFFYDTFLSNRRGVGRLTVPGFMQLTPDVGQFNALDRQIMERIKTEDCEGAIRLAALKQEAVSGFSLLSEPGSFSCP